MLNPLSIPLDRVSKEKLVFCDILLFYICFLKVHFQQRLWYHSFLSILESVYCDILCDPLPPCVWMVYWFLEMSPLITWNSHQKVPYRKPFHRMASPFLCSGSLRNTSRESSSLTKTADLQDAPFLKIYPASRYSLKIHEFPYPYDFAGSWIHISCLYSDSALTPEFTFINNWNDHQKVFHRNMYPIKTSSNMQSFSTSGRNS